MKIIRITTIPLSLNILLKGQLSYLAKHFEVLGVSSSGNLLDEVRTREGIRVKSVEMERGISPFKDLISLIKLYQVFKNEKPHIVHSITPKAGLLSMLAGKLAGVPIRMHTFTGLIFPTKKGLLQKVLIKMDQLLCKSATHIYPEGQGVKNDLITYNITDKPLRVLANGNVNGIDIDYYSLESISDKNLSKLKSSLSIGGDDFVFIFVGRLVGDKGINELVLAFEQIHNSRVKLLLVGPLESEKDPLKANTLSRIKENMNIISVGFQKDVRPYFAISNVLVFPSYREGFPNVVIQAGAMGLPSIVSNINGSNEIIIDGENGIIIPAKNVSALYDSMSIMLHNSQYYNKLKSNVRRIILERYDQQYVWEALLSEYKKILKEKESY